MPCSRHSLPDLPVTAIIPALREALAGASAAVLTAPPGSGKTTLVPLELLDQSWLAGRRILMLEPRRLAARAAAARMAQLLGEPLGATVGYRIRFERVGSATTRIEVLTEGILTQRLQRDPSLEGVGLVIFDEFHERSQHADLALALCLDVLGALRDDLRLLVMSATLDTGPVASVLGDAPRIVGQGRSFPVAIRYLQRDGGGDLISSVSAGVQRALAETLGDLLVFLPGVGEIRALLWRLENLRNDGLELCPLYGDLPQAAQQRALMPVAGRRRVVLATAVAETSLTIEGIHTVVDAGLSRRPRFDPNTGLTRLETIAVSLASADQRAGRAGRLGPGVCYRLWTRSRHAGLKPHTPPEILSTDLAPLALELARWGVGTPGDLKWLDPPPAGAFAQARALLQALDALDAQGRITRSGREMAAVSLHPRLAHMLLEARAGGQDLLGADLAALLSERDIFRRQGAEPVAVDLELRLRVLKAWRAGDRVVADQGACARVDQVSRQLRRGLAAGSPSSDSGCSPGMLLAMAYPDRIARRRGGGEGRYRLVSGRGARLPGGDALAGEPFLVVAALDAGKAEGRIFLAAPIGLDEIGRTQGNRIQRHENLSWDPRTQAVVAREEERLGALCLAERPLPSADPERLRAAMLDGIRRMGLEVLPWTREARELQSRLLCLRAWQPQAGWPEVADAALVERLAGWLAPWLDGIRRRDQLKRLDLTAILSAELDWVGRQRLEQLAPTHVRVPSGSRKRLSYAPGEPPVLAVRLQEMFGESAAPRVCDGRVPVILHLLSPAQRPLQITQDLTGFWEHTYPEVKKEMKGRYPKHHWPDDPLRAVPTAKARPRRG